MPTSILMQRLRQFLAKNWSIKPELDFHIQPKNHFSIELKDETRIIGEYFDLLQGRGLKLGTAKTGGDSIIVIPSILFSTEEFLCL